MNLQLCLFFAKLYQLAVPSAAKTFSAGKQVHRFNQIGLTLGIFAVNHIYIVKIQRRSAAAGLKFFARPGRGAHILVRINFHFNRAYNIDEQARKVNNYFYINSTK